MILAVFFLNVSPQAKETKRKETDGLRRTRKLTRGGDHQQNRKATTEREKAFANCISRKG